MKKIAVLATSLLFGCHSQPKVPEQPIRLNPSGVYIHRSTGFRFPLKVGPFTRSGIIEYNQQKTDVSAGYDKLAGPESIASTVYVYPAPPLTSIGSPESVVNDAKDHLCTGAWEGIKADIVRAHSDAEMIELGTVTSPSPIFSRQGHRAVFLFSGNLGGKEQPVRSEADLFCYLGGAWLVAYRTTAPAKLDYRADLIGLMRELTWPSTFKG